MIIRDLTNEESADTYTGSMSPDQIFSRLWMSKRLENTGKDIDNAVVLGSWYGVLPYILKRNNKIKNITAVDNIPGCIKVSKKLNPEVAHIVNDCNKVPLHNYQCVINPSINNITDDRWYNNIKPGTLCLFQTENVSVEKNCPSNLAELKHQYPLSTYLYQGVLNSSDNDGPVVRSMVIGYK
jgi:hypothetical protein